MRKILRLATSAIAFVFLALFTIAVETVAGEEGFTGYIKSLLHGTAHSLGPTYFQLISYGTAFFVGAALALWIDALLRKPDPVFTSKRRGGRVSILFPEKRIVKEGLVSDVDFEVLDSIFTETPSGIYGRIFRLTIGFGEKITDPAAVLFSSIHDLKWRVVKLSNSFTVIDITCLRLYSDLMIEIAEKVNADEKIKIDEWTEPRAFKASNYPPQLLPKVEELASQ